jgi:hypothetical protein
MERSLKQHVAAGALALALLGGSGIGVAAQGNQNQTGGAAGLVAAVVQVATDDVVTIQIIDSLNNLRALNNVLNNSPILSQNDIDVVVQDVDVDVLNITVGDITVQDFLNQNDIDVDVVVGVAVLDTGDVIVFI